MISGRIFLIFNPLQQVTILQLRMLCEVVVVKAFKTKGDNKISTAYANLSLQRSSVDSEIKTKDLTEDSLKRTQNTNSITD